MQHYYSASLDRRNQISQHRTRLGAWDRPAAALDRDPWRRGQRALSCSSLGFCFLWLTLTSQSLVAGPLPGTVSGWGTNLCGDANVPAGLSNIVGIAASFCHNLALRTDGTVEAWPAGLPQTTVPFGLTNVVAVAAGASFHLLPGETACPPRSYTYSSYSLALRADGTLASWGYYAPSITRPWGPEAASAVTPNLSAVVAIAAGPAHTLALKSDGTVAAWGANDTGQTDVPATLSNVVAIAAGGYWQALCVAPSVVSNLQVGYSLALKSDGSLTAWGAMTVPVGMTNLAAVAAGYRHVLALRQDGTVAAWPAGFAETKVPSGLNSVVAVAAGRYHSVALKSNGRVAAWGNVYQGSTNVPSGLTNAVAIAGGFYHNLAITSRLPLASLRLEGADAIIRFPTVSGAHYVLERTTNLAAANWSNFLGISIEGNGQDAQVTDKNAALSSRARFYRVRHVP